MTLSEIRRDRLRALVEQHGGRNLSEMLGYTQPSFLSQMAGPNPTREITEKTARKFEEKLGLQSGELDRPLAQIVRESTPLTSAPPAPPAPENMELLGEVIRLVGEILTDEGVEVSYKKLTEIIALTYVDAVEHNATARPDHIKKIVRLFK